MMARTPQTVSPEIQEFCRSINANAEPRYVGITPEAGCMPTSSPASHVLANEDDAGPRRLQTAGVICAKRKAIMADLRAKSRRRLVNSDPTTARLSSRGLSMLITKHGTKRSAATFPMAAPE